MHQPRNSSETWEVGIADLQRDCRPTCYGDTWEQVEQFLLADPTGRARLERLRADLARGTALLKPIVVEPATEDGGAAVVDDGHARVVAVALEGVPTIKVTTELSQLAGYRELDILAEARRGQSVDEDWLERLFDGLASVPYGARWLHCVCAGVLPSRGFETTVFVPEEVADTVAISAAQQWLDGLELNAVVRVASNLP